jgi:ribonuclease HI
MIQEPYVVKSRVCGYPINYRIFYDMNNDRPKTAIIVVNNEIQALFLQTFSNNYSTLVKLQFRSKEFLYISLYCSPLKDINEELLHINSALSKLKPNNLLIAMDSNAKSKVWFSQLDDSRGEAVNEFVAENNLLILNNNPYLPTFHTPRGNSFIDLTLINTNSINLVHHWQTLQTDSLSDHRFIQFVIADGIPVVEYKNTNKYVTKTANWDLFRESIKPLLQSLNDRLENIDSGQQFNGFIASFSNSLTQICDKTFKKSGNIKNRNTNSWWCHELTIKRNQMNTSRRRYQRCQSERRGQLVEEYLSIKSQYKHLLNTRKIDSWNHFIETNSRENPWGISYAISKDKIKVEKVSELLDSSGRLLTDNKEIANTLLNSLFPDDQPLTDNEFHKTIRIRVDDYFNLFDGYSNAGPTITENIVNYGLGDCPQQQMESCTSENTNCGNNDHLFTEPEVTQIVSQQNNAKSPGEDGFNAAIVKEVHKSNPQFLTKLYNKSLILGVFPNVWKTSVVKVIRKPGDRDYRKPNSYRPISLLSVFAKILEKLLINRITYYLKINGLLGENQFGFTAQKSTIDAIISAIDFIKSAYEKKGFALLIPLDIAGAFDHTSWPMILYSLIIMKCPKNLLLLTKSYFSDRYAKLWYQNVEVIKKLSKGCPQGSSCGPGFWNIKFNSSLKLDFPQMVRLNGFADDALLQVFAQTIPELETKANEALSRLSDWSRDNKLEFNETKTTAVLFTKNQKFSKPKIIFNGYQIELSTNFKYLGLYIDNQLNWKFHLNYVKAKAQQLIIQLISFTKKKYGLNDKALEVIYKGAVVPIIAYACPVWIQCIDYQYIKKPLESIQRLIGLRLCRAYKTVSSNALNIIANLMPLDLVVKQRALEYQFTHSIDSNLREMYFHGLNIDFDNIQKAFPKYSLPHPAFPVKLDFINFGPSQHQLPTDSQIIESLIHSNFNDFSHQRRLDVYGNIDLKCFTDGSKNHIGVGSGFCILRGDQIIKSSKFKLASYCSVFQAQLLAILQAIKYINSKFSSTTVIIFTGSQTAIKALQDSNSLTFLIQQVFTEVTKGKEKELKFKFTWIRSHSGEVGKEMADSLAKQGAVSHRSIDFELIPMSFIKKYIHNNNIDIWNRRWTSSSTGETTRRYFPTIQSRLIVKHTFKPDFYVTQLLTNHGKFNFYLNRFKLKNNPDCDFCVGITDNAEHIIYYCPNFDDKRQQLINQIQQNNNVWPINQQNLVSAKVFNHFKDFCNSIMRS